MNKFENALFDNFNKSQTENGALAFRTSKNPLVDMLADGGAMRNSSKEEIQKLFKQAYFEDSVAAVVLMFYFRDVREGQGERRFFKECFEKLIELDKESAEKVLKLIPEYGRWDDMFVANNTPIEDVMFDIIRKQLSEDVFAKEEKNVSLLAKWLPTERRHGKTDPFACKMIDRLGLTPKIYRKSLTDLRKKIDIVERKMSENRFNEIDYSRVPSQAFNKYSSAFSRKDEDRFLDYIEKVNSGEKKINTATLYPYQIIEKISDGGWGYISAEESELKTARAMWKNLPDYYDNSGNTLIVADVSGSMIGRPMSMSVSLAIYCSERNTGFYKNRFMTFSERPDLIKIQEEEIDLKAAEVAEVPWGMNTDMNAVFEKVLDSAVSGEASQEDLPERIVVISDMQFDEAIRDPWRRSSERKTLTQETKGKFKRHGLKLPKLVYWNVNATPGTFPMEQTEEGLMVSGASPEIMKSVLKDELIYPIDIVNEILNRERYMPVFDALR